MDKEEKCVGGLDQDENNPMMTTPRLAIMVIEGKVSTVRSGQAVGGSDKGQVIPYAC